jgi:TonB family protein
MKLHPIFTAALLQLSLVLIPAFAQQEPAPTASSLLGGSGYSCEIAEYPRAARIAETKGTVEIAFDVLEDGSVSNIRVTKSSGETKEHKQLDTVSRLQVASCKYRGSGPKLEPRTHKVRIEWWIG